MESVKYVKDAFGQRIKVGDGVGYSGSLGRHAKFFTGTVTGVLPANKVTIEAHHSGREVVRRGCQAVRAVIPQEED